MVTPGGVAENYRGLHVLGLSQSQQAASAYHFKDREGRVKRGGPPPASPSLGHTVLPTSVPILMPHHCLVASQALPGRTCFPE